MRTLLEKTREAQALRVASDPSADHSRVTIEDIVTAATGQRPEDGKNNEVSVAAAFAKLDAMVGLAPVKQEVRQLQLARGRTEAPRAGTSDCCAQPAMVFTGPPGVGKTRDPAHDLMRCF